MSEDVIDKQSAVEKHAAIFAQQAMFQENVDALTKEVGSIIYTVIATDDGFPIAYTKLDEKDAIGKAALAASLSGLGNTIASESSLDYVEAVHVECGSGFVFSRGVDLKGKKVVLLVGSTNELNLATLLWYIKKMVDTIVEKF